MTMASLSIVKDFDVIEDIRPGQVTSFVDPLSDSFFFLGY